MRVLVTGGKGLLAYWLAKKMPATIEVTLWDVEEFDLTRRDGMAKSLSNLRPELVVNTAAYNLVEQCETERELSWAVNARGPQSLAELCAESHCPLVHFSSDYVFDGLKNAPYVETDLPNPVNHYGAGKLYGEQAVIDTSPSNLVLRTSWLFGFHPTQAKSYVHSVLRQARKGEPLKATTDQVAAPTYAPDLADWVIHLVQQGAAGLFHAVNTEGLSRYEWTQAILERAKLAGLIDPAIIVDPVLTSAFKSNMRRPHFSVLDNHKASARMGKPIGSWRKGLDEMLRTLS